MPRKRGTHQFTLDEAQTAALLAAEGSISCATLTMRYKGRTYRVPMPQIDIKMCDREALEPAARVLSSKIYASKEKTVVCPPHLFPPDGKGTWRVIKRAR